LEGIKEMKTNPSEVGDVSEAQAEAKRRHYQRVLDDWVTQQRYFADLEDEWDYSTGFRERRHKTSFHRGRSDSDW
jgi:hypothetical protein